MMFRKLLSRPVVSFFISRQASDAYPKPKRFYKEVSVNSVNDTQFEVLLDKRKLKTPKGSPLILNSEPLALVIAQEWDSQKETLDIPHMRVSGLTFTTIDNPNHETPETLTDKIIEYLDTDTLLYMAPTPKELHDLEQEKWLPIINWANEKHELALRPSYSLTELVEIPKESRAKIYRHFFAMGFPALNGILYGVDSIKSVLLMLACLQFRLSAEEAAKLANLEIDYQLSIYQKVEGHHDVQECETLSRLSACLLYIQMSTYTETRTPIMATS